MIYLTNQWDRRLDSAAWSENPRIPGPADLKCRLGDGVNVIVLERSKVEMEGDEVAGILKIGDLVNLCGLDA
jgi:hypothetical protein